MKNLKRALSLALTAAMMVGMMVVGTGASYKDVTAEHNEEAIAVVSAAGIMGANDTFEPDAKITRNEMAVVMCNMLDLDVADFAGASDFTDVPAWAADYVDACYANGIVSGVSATQYNGSANVTTVEASLMMLKALGYFEYKDFGDDWSLTTIKKAAKIDLLDGIDAKTTAALTRNEVAQLALNALEANTVDGVKSGSSTSITAGDVEVKVDAAVTYYNNSTKYDYDNSKDDVEQLIEKLYGEDYTKTEGGKTDLGLPAVVWYDNEEKETIIKAADEADDVVISDAEYANDELADAYTDLVDEDYDADDDYALVWAVENADITYGDVVYFYENDDTDTITAYIVRYQIAEVTDIDDEITKAKKEDGATALVTIEIDGVEYEIYDNNFAGFDYEEDDYVLVVLNEDEDEVLASEAAKSVEGKITNVASSSKIKIDGTTYKNVSGEDVAEDDEITAYLNKAGQIALITDVNAASSDAYAYIYNAKVIDGDVDEDGNDNSDPYVYVVLADGTKTKYTMDEDNYSADLKGSVVAYDLDGKELEVVDADDEIVYVAALTMSEDVKSVKIDGKTVRATSATEFIFASWDDDAMVVTTATGVKNVDVDAENAWVIYNDDKEIEYVFVLAEDEGLESDTVFAVLKNTSWTRAKNDDDEYVYTYNVIVGTEETTVDFIGADLAGYKKGAIIAYYMDGDYAELDQDEIDALTEGTIEYVGEDYIVIDGTEYTYEDADMYRLTKEYEDEADYAAGKVDTASVKAITSFSKDAKVLFTANDDDEIETIYVVKEIY